MSSLLQPGFVGRYHNVSRVECVTAMADFMVRGPILFGM